MATSRTSKTGIRIYVSNSGMGWISAFPPGNTACGNVSACADWAITQFRKGAVSAVSRLDVHEREAVISSRDGCNHGVDLWDCAMRGADSFALYLEEWFTKIAEQFAGEYDGWGCTTYVYDLDEEEDEAN